MSTNAHSTYRSFAEIGDENHVLIHVLPNDRNQKDGPPVWQQYMHDLDDFFIRLYEYHQKSGFMCLICGQLLELSQIIFSVMLPLFFLNCINYDILFKNKPPPGQQATAKVHIYDVIVPLSVIELQKIQILAIVLACVFWLWKFLKFVHSLYVNLAIRQFYKQVLHIQDCSSLTWQDVQSKLINNTKPSVQHVQHVQHQLTELDVHNRILRHTNYMIALINRGMLPIHYRIPILGTEITYFTQGFLYNCQLLFFRGPFKCIFEENWKLDDDVKCSAQRQVCAQKLARNCVKLAWINLILSPVVLVWQFLYFFYSNAALVKRDPAMLFGARNWSLYARWFCRHFNELDHQLNDRLNHGYKSANKYMNAFTSPFLEIIARHVMFVAGSILAVLVALTVYDEDVITVEHVITLMTGLTFLIAIAHAFIPPEVPQKFTKSELYDEIIKNIHYVPQNYPPFTPQARASMANLFQYKLVRLLEDLASTVLTPYILLQHLRPRSLDLVDFFRNFTVEISNTGDVCVFSMMNIKENGNPQWQLTGFQAQPDNDLDNADKSSKVRDQQFRQTSRKVVKRVPGSDLYGDEIDLEIDDADDDDQHKLENSRQLETTHNDTQVRLDAHPRLRGQVERMERESENQVQGQSSLLSRTEHGKLELSLIHFKLQNPTWKPENESQREYIDQVAAYTVEELNQRSMSSNLVSGQGQTRSLSSSSHFYQSSHAHPTHHSMGPMGNDPQTLATELDTRNMREIDSICQRSPTYSSIGVNNQFRRPKEIQKITDIDSSTAVSLSTLFLHEHARSPMQSTSISRYGTDLISSNSPLVSRTNLGGGATTSSSNLATLYGGMQSASSRRQSVNENDPLILKSPGRHN